MSARAQRVVVIQDATKDLSSSSSALQWALDSLLLKPGDGLTLLGILHQVNTPSTFPLKGAKKLLGYKIRADSNSMFGLNQKVITEEVARKEEEYQKNMEILQIRKLYEINQIDFGVIVKPASSPKAVALEVAKQLKATWVVLDRQMKKDKKYFMEKLSCGISRMKRDNSIEQFRGPRGPGNDITYKEMIPGPPLGRKEEIAGSPTKKGLIITGISCDDEDDLFSLDISPIRTLNTQKNRLSASSSSEEPKFDIGQGHSWATARTSSSSTYTSNEQPPLLSTSQNPKQRKKEASSSSCFRDEKENHTDSQREPKNYKSPNALIDAPKIGKSETHKAVDESEEPSQSYMQDFLKSGLADSHFKNFETSKCLFCRNGRPRIQRKREFTYAELEIATGRFSRRNYISEGGFGSVYKGQLEDGQWIAVKQHKDASFQGEKEFKSEVQALTRAKHRNVVRLLGSCLEGNHRLLVYEFICNGSLEKHLSYESATPLDWRHRMRIALGAARGLKYLHQSNIIHRDMRPSNILVTHDYEPMLGDFGLARTQQNESDGYSDTRVVGTVGYLAPEYAQSGKVSPKIDVYSFGVILLELITGRRGIDKTSLEGEKGFLEWAKPLLEERMYHSLIDSRISDLHDVHQLFGMVYVAERCLKNDPTKRSSMKEVVHNLKCIMRGESVSEIGDCPSDCPSPHSDSDNSIRDSTESESNDEKVVQEAQSTEISSISSKSQISENFPTSSSSKSSSSIKSARRSTSLDNLFKTDRKSSKEKRVNSRSQIQLPYDEMLL